MAEPKAETPKQSKPNLVAVDGDKKAAAKAAPATANAATAPAPAAQQESLPEEKSSRWGLWLLVLLMLAAGVTALMQTQRLAEQTTRATALSEQVLSLEAQLSAANTQISTFQMQRGQIRDAVVDLSQRMILLGELVGDGQGLSEPTPAP